MIFTAFLIATIILVVFTLLPMWRYEAWWLRSLDFPRLQLLLISILLLLAETILLDLLQITTWGLLVVTLLCLVYHAWWILPYTRVFPVEVKSAVGTDAGRSLRIMTANVLTPNRNAEALIERVRENGPDILVTLESDAWWQARLDTLEPSYPHTIKCPLDNLYGMHVYSKLPLKDSRIEYLVEADIPSMHTLVSLPSGHQIRTHFLHPAPPSPTENEESSERDAELIIVAKSVAETEAPVIVTGDLNDVAWSETTRLFRKISGLLDPRIGRGMFNTFHADYWFFRWPLDHLFHSDHFTLSRICRLKVSGSDHFALFTELVLEGGRDDQQSSLKANEDDLAWAKGKADDQGVSKKDVPEPGKD
ncbi:MAG: endonuclease/exonuclease/phosphatase family protein [Desulfobacterales bacterium]|jgi:endonuclease/exonuclease/phosphatase (EEP) superfamily protein YafD